MDLYRLPTARPAGQALGLATLLGLVAIAAGALLAAQELARRVPPPIDPFAPALLGTARYAAAIGGALLVGGLVVDVLFRRRGLSVLLLPLALLLPALARGPLYSPLLYLRLLWHPRPALAAPLRASHVLFGGIVLGVLYVLPRAVREIRRMPVLRPETHGSARWVTAGELSKAGLFASDGILLGRVADEPRPVADSGDAHLAVVAPSGAGKTTCLVLPALFTAPGTVIALDVKGELFSLTSGFRQSALGHEILRFDPTDMSGTAARFNPLDTIPRDDRDVAAAQAIAQVLVTAEKDAHSQTDDFWTRSAASALVTFLLHSIYCRGENTASLSHTLALASTPDLSTLLLEMSRWNHDPHFARQWRSKGQLTFTHPAIQEGALQLAGIEPRTRDGIVATVNAALATFRDGILARNTSTSDFSLQELLEAGSKKTLYVTIPPTRIDQLRPLLRVFVRAVLEAATQRPTGRYGPADRLLLILDEFPVLGRLEILQSSIAFLRGYGVKVFLAAQTIGQIEQAYGQHQSILPNCRIILTFAPADLKTAEMFSKMTGQQTVHIRRRSSSTSWKGGSSTSLADQDHARPLLTADEVRRLPSNEALLIVAGLPPARLLLKPFYQQPELLRRSQLPPAAGRAVPAVLPPIALDDAYSLEE